MKILKEKEEFYDAIACMTFDDSDPIPSDRSDDYNDECSRPDPAND